MILRTIINIVRLTWGFEPVVVNEIDECVAMVMMFGAFIDILALIGIVALIVNAIAAHNRVAKAVKESEAYVNADKPLCNANHRKQRGRTAPNRATKGNGIGCIHDCEHCHSKPCVV